MKLYRITVEAITLFSLSKRSARGSYGAQLEEAVEGSNGRIRWKKVCGPIVADDSPEAALLNMAQALEHYGGVDGFREGVASAKNQERSATSTPTHGGRA